MKTIPDNVLVKISNKNDVDHVCSTYNIMTSTINGHDLYKEDNDSKTSD